jgi:hypothetical protein
MFRPSRFSRKNLKRKIDNKAATPVVEQAAEEVAETEEAIVHLGGPWYSVGGEKVMGRSAAEAKALELGLL